VNFRAKRESMAVETGLNVKSSLFQRAFLFMLKRADSSKNSVLKHKNKIFIFVF
jgi:hypothetical protein